MCVHKYNSTQLGVQRLCRRLLHSAHFVYFANLTNEQVMFLSFCYWPCSKTLAFFSTFGKLIEVYVVVYFVLTQAEEFFMSVFRIYF